MPLLPQDVEDKENNVRKILINVLREAKVLK